MKRYMHFSRLKQKRLQETAGCCSPETSPKQGKESLSGRKKKRKKRESRTESTWKVGSTPALAEMAHRNKDTPSKFRCSKKKPAEEPVVTGPNMDSLGFQAMDSNIPGLSQVILRKLNMKSYDEYKSAMDGKKGSADFGIRTYFDMFKKMEDTFKFCVECKKLPDALPDSKNLRRCKRCQNVYYCSPECQRANWPVHKKFCKKLKLVALDRLVEWLIFTGDIPFHTETWTKRIQEVKGWEDWFAMQEHLDEKLGAILTGRYMTILWANAGKPKPEEGELLESIKRLTSDFQSRPITIGLGLHAFSIDPYAKPITVHVAGASHIETLNTRVIDYDELTRIFPGHQGIEVVMVGVDVVDGSIMRPPLTAFGPRGRVYLSSYKGLYHDFWESQVETQQAAHPDLVVGFHPGFHACQDLMEGWLPTLLLLRDYKIPTLFTVYNEQELKSSLKILMELETNITGCGANPFASLKPEQVYSSPNKPPVYCSSHYIMFHGLSSPPYEPDIRELEEEEDKGE
ncbi:putative MSS51-like protein, mitochondrial [Alligator mississippiensis]|uniref:MSS51-like protein, mitochondrial n=2 Tax=Alligator mississippiensis TaxID=8496 RepID=A0A151N6M1_ALLMI|nr:putative MSS51-like protein, mitochondrial [Alligator mississippiensis]